MILFHGSNKIVQSPQYGIGKSYNDYGSGFYCTENLELAKEWACKNREGGFVNQYEISLYKLNILDLTKEEYSVLHWLTLLIENREVRLASPIMKKGRDWLHNHYYIDTKEYDMIKGYRADDSYFAFVRAFLNNEITLEQLSIAINLGELGIQWMLKSHRAFSQLHFEKYEIEQNSIYYSKRKQRDEQARNAYNQILESTLENGTYLADLLKKQG